MSVEEKVAADKLVGRWRLISWSSQNEEGAIAFPLGERLEGSLVYTRGGWITTMLAAGGRANLSTEDLVGGSEPERAAAFSTYISYCGTYEVEGDAVVHRIEMSLFPNWVGDEQTRHFEVSETELVLRTPPVKVGGEVVVSELRWAREE
jgi:Lipocalin-like domain